MTPQAGHLRRAGAGLGIALLLPNAAAEAAQWTVKPDARLQALAETNPGLIADRQRREDGQAIIAGGDLLLRRSTELTAIELSAGAAQRRYQQASAMDRTDLDIALALQSRHERWSWQAGAVGKRDTTLTSELGLSGLSDVNRRHESASGSFGLSWAASERLTATAGAAVQFDFYPGQQTDLVDYRYRSAHAGGSYALSPRSTLGITARRGELDISGGGFSSTDSTLMLQYQFRLTERINLALAAGPSWTKGRFSSERGESFTFSLSHGDERMTTSLTAQRRIAPTGRGYLTEQDNAGLQLSVRLRERLTSTLGASYLRSKDVLSGFGISFGETRYRRATAGLNWQMRERWSLGFGAGYADQISRRSAARADGYDFRLGVTWNGGAHVW